jgi:tRNA-(ms[2]io[6]A)-hydroxylase
MPQTDLSHIHEFLPCPTPTAWVEAALRNQQTLLIDHAHCEKKAASTALGLMYRYMDDPDLLHRMSRLAREELRHFEQVLAILEKRGIEYGYLSPARYAGALHAHARKEEPGRLVDTLIIGAIIEARSCERFAEVAPHLDEELAEFYNSLLKSEARHYEDYLRLAEKAAGEAIDERVLALLAVEREQIESPDEVFRFHSGIPRSLSSGSGLGAQFAE